MKKILAVLLAMTLILTLFAGCSSAVIPTADGSDKTTKATADKDDGPKLTKDQKKIDEDLAKEFGIEGFEKQIAAEVKEDEDTVATIESLGIDADEYIEAIMKHYGWTWDPAAIAVDGDKAVAKVTMTYPDFDTMSDMLDEKSEEWLKTIDKDSMDEATFYKEYGKLVMEVMHAEDFPELTSDFDIDYVKDGGTWKMADEDAVLSELNEAQGAGDAA